ncbi:VanZ family protein [Acaryochloris sp. 'Moss Beach']|nr:VanZ family protein [Acaryochloris marina S15]UJB71968.1 VanZ family protein [Acaryochloris sp. 'Moss Beach']
MAIMVQFSTQRWGGEQTQSILTALLNLSVPALLNGLSPEQLHTLNFIVRKGAHLTEYAILTTLCFTMGTFGFQKPWKSVLPFAVLGSALFAITDEIHQNFVPNRGASPIDVLIDITGALIAVSLISLWKTRFQPNPPQNL